MQRQCPNVVERRGHRQIQDHLGVEDVSDVLMLVLIGIADLRGAPMDAELLAEKLLSSRSTVERRLRSYLASGRVLKERTLMLKGCMYKAPVTAKLKGAAGEKVVQRQADRDYHPLDDRPYANLGGGDSGDFKKKKGRGGIGKVRLVKHTILTLICPHCPRTLSQAPLSLLRSSTTLI